MRPRPVHGRWEVALELAVVQASFDGFHQEASPFAVRVEGSPLVALSAIVELVQSEFGLSDKNLLVLNSGKLASWRFLKKRF